VKKSIFILAACCLQTLSGQTIKRSETVVLNLAEAFARQQEVKLSDLVSKISYIILENNSKAPVAASSQFEVTDDFVIVRQMGAERKWQILLFERNSGRFLREIGKQGRGPGEFVMYSLIQFNTFKKEIYGIDAHGNLLIYNLMGEYIAKINMPDLSGTKTSGQTSGLIPAAFNSVVDGDAFVIYIGNISGSEKRKLILVNANGITKVFPNYLTWDAGQYNGKFFPPPWGFSRFYTWENKLNFSEIYCDTLYQVTKESLKPRYYFDWGRFNAPYSKQVWITDREHFYDYFWLTDIFESKRNIFIRINLKNDDYTAIVDKGGNKVTFCKTGSSGISGFRDDMDNLMDIIPQGVTPNNEMTWTIQPIELLKWMKENPEKATMAKNHLPWLNKIDEFSNPIIAIAKCIE